MRGKKPPDFWTTRQDASEYGHGTTGFTNDINHNCHSLTGTQVPFCLLRRKRHGTDDLGGAEVWTHIWSWSFSPQEKENSVSEKLGAPCSDGWVLPLSLLLQVSGQGLTLVALPGQVEVQPVMQRSVSAWKNLGGFPQFLLEYLLAAALPVWKMGSPLPCGKSQPSSEG